MDIAQSTSKLFIVQASNALISIFAISYFANQLGASVIGFFFLFQALLGIFSIPADFGLRRAIEKRISEGGSENEYFTSGLVLKFILLLLFSLFILIAKNPINSYVGTEIALLLIAGLIIKEFAQTIIQVLNAELRVGETAIILLINKVTWLCVGSLLIEQNIFSGVRSIIFGFLAGNIAMLIIGIYRTSTSFGSPTISHLYSLLDFGKFSFIGSIGGYVYNWLDVLILGLFVSQSLVGAYEVAWRVSIVVMFLPRAIWTTIYPQMSSWHADGAMDKIEDLLSKMVIPSIYFAVPAFIGIIAFSKDVLSIVFGSEFTVAWVVLIVLMAEKMQRSIFLLYHSLVDAADRPELNARTTVISLLINIILNFFLIPIIGIVGAALATTLSSLVRTLLTIRYTKSLISIEFPKLAILWSFISSLIMASFIFYLKDYTDSQTLFSLITIIFIGFVVYNTIMLLNPRVRRETSAVYSSILD